MSFVVRDLSQRKPFKNLNGEPVLKIQEKFVTLCFAVHPEAIGIEMSSSPSGRIVTQGQVLGHQSRVLGSYQLVCGSEGFQLMETQTNEKKRGESL